MSIEAIASKVPQFDVADRMRKALREGGLSVQEMAEYLEVSRNTVGRWINGKVPPSTSTLRLWALRTGVPFEWLRDGFLPTGGDLRSRVTGRSQVQVLPREHMAPVRRIRTGAFARAGLVA
jgi:transcriptional regulator with XRE-family HTH domain